MVLYQSAGRRNRTRLIRLWKSGPFRQPRGALHVSMNDYWVDRWRDVPRIALAGMRLRRTWPRTSGAAGLWFALFALGKRQVSVSIWRGRADLDSFVASPAHRRVMRQFRGAGTLYTTTWTADSDDPIPIWTRAEDRLYGRVAGVPHH
jgi:hypothetical protein